MNMWIVVLIMIPVLAIMFLGGNPVRDFQKKQQELAAKYGTDELTNATLRGIENNERASGQASSFEGVSSSDLISSIKTVSPPIRYEDDLTVREPSMNDRINSSALFRKNPAPPTSSATQLDDGFDKALSGTVAVGQPLQPAQSVRSANTDNYYPPIVSSMNAASTSAAPQAVLTGKEVKLRSGQIIIFEGVYVYTVNTSGGRVAMPDGEYILQDGGSILVSGGKNIAK